jgi:uncharacterized repeat protein (TIGR03837 family)
MQWDVFCRVIDNFGDIGVCWRLALDLSQRGEQVRLWVDDPAALQWMAPQVRWQASLIGHISGQGQPSVEVFRWADAERDLQALPGLAAGDVVVEAFGCDPPLAFIERMQARAQQGHPPAWVNLEYLSAENYVERSHGLASPVWAGPGAGLRKRFFYPGFTPATGGLLREPGLIALRQGQTATEALRHAHLASVGVIPQPGDRFVLLFCYDSAPLGELLDQLAARPETTQVLLTPGPASRLGREWLARHPSTGLRTHFLPALPQAEFDLLLWCCDLNLVRGEDSAVRALWAGRPHIWQIYEQDDGVHAAKLAAFLARWAADWPDALRTQVSAWWLAWNRLGPMPAALPDWQSTPNAWLAASKAARGKLLVQADLGTQLLDFVTSSG